MNKISRRKMLLPGIGAGLVILLMALIFRPSPPSAENYSAARKVDVVALKKQLIAPKVIGYGRIQPKYRWQAITEVKGRVIYRHPLLESGRVLPAGLEVLRIDPLEYELAHAQAKETVNSSEIKLAQLHLEDENLLVSLTIEEQKLVFAKQELERKQNLKKQGLISASELESQQQTWLSQKQLVQDIRNRLTLMPDEKKVAKAQLIVDQARLADAARLLANTRVKMPFEARIDEVNIEFAQLVSAGSLMITADRIGALEVEAEFALTSVNDLIASMKNNAITSEPGFIDVTSLVASIELTTQTRSINWPAKVTRITETVDPITATVGVYLEVEPAHQKQAGNDALWLGKGMLVTSQVTGVASEQFIIPEKALHSGRIYIANKKNQLEIRTVEVLFRNGTEVAISGKLSEGEYLVLNDLIPAVPGMLLSHKAEQVSEPVVTEESL